jgi:hypothetical protein
MHSLTDRSPVRGFFMMHFLAVRSADFAGAKICLLRSPSLAAQRPTSCRRALLYPTSPVIEQRGPFMPYKLNIFTPKTAALCRLQSTSRAKPRVKLRECIIWHRPHAHLYQRIPSFSRRLYKVVRFIFSSLAALLRLPLQCSSAIDTYCFSRSERKCSSIKSSLRICSNTPR